MDKKKKKAMSRHMEEIFKNGNLLSYKLSMKIMEEAPEKDSAIVALLALAKTVADVVDAQSKAGYDDPMGAFITLLEAEVLTTAMEENI